jgi:hypothetical protein
VGSFLEKIQINTDTLIDRNNHELIGMILLSQAQTVEQQQFALYVCFQSDLCWPGFTQLLLMHKSDMAMWVKETLMPINSLRSAVKLYEHTYEELCQRRLEFDISDSHHALHLLMVEEIRQHLSLSNEDLYWYLRGVLEMASKPDIHLDKEQKQEILDRLQEFLAKTDVSISL